MHLAAFLQHHASLRWVGSRGQEEMVEQQLRRALPPSAGLQARLCAWLWVARTQLQAMPQRSSKGTLCWPLWMGQAHSTDAYLQTVQLRALLRCSSWHLLTTFTLQPLTWTTCRRPAAFSPLGFSECGTENSKPCIRRVADSGVLAAARPGRLGCSQPAVECTTGGECNKDEWPLQADQADQIGTAAAYLG